LWGQPGVDDLEMERLVDEKVEAFWKGIENGTIKRGQVVFFVLTTYLQP
jgi:hypothetical protein